MPVGLPLVETLAPGRASFFTYTLTDPFSTVSFALTAYVGAPGLFLSASSNSTRPRGDTPSSFCQSAAPLAADGSGGSQVAYGVTTYSPTGLAGPCACAAPPSPAAPCTLFIGVTAPDFAYFALAATSGSVGGGAGGILPLFDSVPLRSEWRAASSVPTAGTGARTQLYDLRFVPSAVTSSSIVTVELAQTGGDANTVLRARWVPVCTALACAPDTATVSNVSAVYTASLVAGAASLTISRTDPSFLSFCNGARSNAVCTLRIAVTSLFGAQGYVVVARTDGGAQLLDGVPAMGSVDSASGAAARPITYFRFAHITPLAALVFTLTPVNGPVDFFVCSTATPTCLPPSATNNATWAVLATSPSLNAPPATLTVLPGAAGACAPPCAYYLGVRAGAAVSEGVISFSVLARTRGASTNALLDGRAVFDAVEGGGATAFSVFLPAAAPSLLLSLTPLLNDVTLSVSIAGAAPPVPGVAPPAPIVLGPLSAARTESTLLLTRALPLLASACTTSMVVNTLKCFDWTGNVVPPGNYPNDPNVFGCSSTPTVVPGQPAPCTLLLTATTGSAAGASFALAAWQRAGPLLLRDGVTSTLSLPPGATTLYAFEAAAKATHVRLALTQLYGRALGAVSTTSSAPTPATAQWTLGALNGDLVVLDLFNAAACAPTAPRCTYYISMAPWTASTDPGALASAAAQVRLMATSMTVVTVEKGSPTPGRTGPNGFQYYAYTVRPEDAAAGGVDVLVETTRGSGWLLLLAGADPAPSGATALPGAACADGVSSPFACATPPLLANTAVSTTGLASRARLSLRAGATRGWAVGAVFIFALSSAGSTDFELVVRPVGLPIPLPNGLLMHDRLSAASDGPSLFSLTLPAGATPAPLLLEATAISGYPQFWVSAGVVDASSPAPGPGTSDAMFDAATSYSAVLDAPYIAKSCPALATVDCTLTLAVRAAPFTVFPVEYTLSASLTNIAKGRSSLLQPGEPVLSSAVAGAWTYFFAPFEAGGNATITVQDVVGSAAVYVNSGGLFPTDPALPALLRTDGTANPKTLLYKAAALGSLFADPTLLAIGVWTTSPLAQFYISYSTSATVTALPDGASVQAAVEVGATGYFSLSLPAGASASASITRFSGAAALFGGKWYDGVDSAPTGTEAALFTQATAPMRADFQGILNMPLGSQASCAPDSPCTLLLGVTCTGFIPCAFSIAGAATPQSLVRLSDSVPVMNSVQQGGYSYFIYTAPAAALNISFNVQSIMGAVQLLVSSAWAPGVTSPGALPTFAAPSSFAWSTPSSLEIVELMVPQAAPAAPARSPTSGFTPASATRNYVVAVYGLAGPAAFQLMVRPAGGVTTLQPGVPSFTRQLLEPGASDLYVFDNQDMAHDLVLEAVLTYGALTLSASTTSGAWPSCTYTPPAPNAVTGALPDADTPGYAFCPTAMWRADSVGGAQLVLRIAARAPCDAGATPAAQPGACSAVWSWAAGPINLVITATLPSQYKFTATTGSDALTAEDGKRIVVSQPAGSPPQVLQFATDPSDKLSEIFVTFGSDSFAPGYTYYLSSCVSWACTSALTTPVEGSAQLTGALRGGDQFSLTITRGSPAFCDGSALRNETCNYFLTVAPVAADCAARAIAPCTAFVSVTFFSATGMNPMVLDFSALQSRYYVIKDQPLLADTRGLTAAPKRYEFYINRVGAPDSSLVDVTLRIDACDSLRGHAVGFLCLSNPMGRFPACDVLAMPSNATPTASQMMLSTAGSGSAFLPLPSEPSNLMFLAVGSMPFSDPARPVASDAALARSVPPGSSFELSISDGAPLLIKAAPAMAATKISSSEVNVTWTAPLAMAGVDPASPPDAPWFLNATAVGVRYRAYYANNLTDFAMRVTGMSVADLGLMPTTVCGLERWAALVKANFTPPVFLPGAPLVLNIKGLKPLVRYRVNVVAECDEPCQVLNYQRLGLLAPTGSLSTQRTMFPLFYFTLDADPVEHVTEPMSAAFFVLGVLATLGAAGGALVLGFKRGSAEDKEGTKVGAVAAEGGAAKSLTKGPGGRPIVATLNNFFFASRERTAEAAAAGAALGGAAGEGASATGGGRVVAAQHAAELEDLARVATTVFSPQKAPPAGEP